GELLDYLSRDLPARLALDLVRRRRPHPSINGELPQTQAPLGAHISKTCGQAKVKGLLPAGGHLGTPQLKAGSRNGPYMVVYGPKIACMGDRLVEKKATRRSFGGASDRHEDLHGQWIHRRYTCVNIFLPLCANQSCYPYIS